MNIKKNFTLPLHPLSPFITSTPFSLGNGLVYRATSAKGGNKELLKTKTQFYKKSQGFTPNEVIRRPRCFSLPHYHTLLFACTPGAADAERLGEAFERGADPAVPPAWLCRARFDVVSVVAAAKVCEG